MPTILGIIQTLGVPRVAKSLPVVKRFAPIAVTTVDKDYCITGITKDSAGVALGSCTVHMMFTQNDVLQTIQVSDPITGAYAICVQPTVTYYAVAYKAGSPDVAGTTVNTLVGT